MARGAEFGEEGARAGVAAAASVEGDEDQSVRAVATDCVRHGDQGRDSGRVRIRSGIDLATDHTQPVVIGTNQYPLPRRSRKVTDYVPTLLRRRAGRSVITGIQRKFVVPVLLVGHQPCILEHVANPLAGVTRPVSSGAAPGKDRVAQYFHTFP